MNQKYKPSPFRALLWKEWRQQRWVFLFLFALAYALAISGHFVGKAQTPLTSLGLGIVLVGLASLIGTGGILVISANAFAGERDENTERFIETIPCSRNRIFWVKFGFALILVLLGFAPLGVWALFHVTPGSINLGQFWTAAFVIAGSVIVMVTVPAFIGSFGASVISAVLVSIPVAAACVAWMLFLPAALPGLAFIRPAWAFCLSFFLIATLLLAARQLWTKVERSWRKCAPTLAVTAVLLIGYVVVPITAVWIYVTFLAPLSFFLSGNQYGGSGYGLVSARPSTLSPKGEFVVLDARCAGWGPVGERGALVNVESGRYQWLSRFRPSFAWRPHTWGPSGERFVMEELGCWLWPLAYSGVSPSYSPTRTYVLVDALTGAQRKFDELCPGLPKMTSAGYMALVGWCSEHVFAFTDGRDIFFADVERHKVNRCMAPRTSPKQPVLGSGLLTITQQGIFVLLTEPAREGLRLLRFAPDLSEAECIVLGGVPGLPGQIKASADGRWLLPFAKGYRYAYWYMARSENGAEATLLQSEKPDDKGLIPPSWRVNGFLPSGHQILLYRDEPRGLHVVDSEDQMGFGCKLGLFDADSHDLRRISFTALKGTAGRVIESVQPSPSGEFALVRFRRPGGGPFAWPAYVVSDLRDGSAWNVLYAAVNTWPNVRWLGNDRLLIEDNGQLSVMNRDGTGRRPLLAK